MRGQAVGTFLAPQYVGNATSYNIVATPAGPDTIWVPGAQLFACNAASADCFNGQTIKPTDEDRRFIGTANPSFTVGLHNNATWNNFDASWLWRGEFGGKVFNNTALIFQTKASPAQGRNFLRKAMDDPDNIHEPSKFSTRWIEDRTFVRLQNVTVGYTLPKTLMGGRATRVYLSGDNLALFTKYSGYDPEVFTDANRGGVASRGVDYLTFPPTRNFTVGARTQF
jgi:iron complex outermembrane receptor protein